MKSREPKLIFLTGEFFPTISSVSKCVLNLAKEAAKTNEVTIVCVDTSGKHKSGEIIEGIEFVFIDFPHIIMRTRLSNKRKDSHGFMKAFWHTVFMLFNLKKFISMILFRKIMLFKKAVKSYGEALEKCKTGKSNILIPCCMPAETFEAAMASIKKDDNTFMVPILFDPFADNGNIYHSKIIKFLKYNNNLAFERSLIRSSNRFLYISHNQKFITDNFAEFKDKMVKIEHPFSDYSVGSFGANGNEKREVDPKEITLLYTGTVGKKVRPVDFTIDFLDKILSVNKNLFAHFFISGEGTDLVRKISKKNRQIVLHPWGTLVEVEEAIKKADMFISIGNIRGICQIPGKLSDYIITGKPIIHFYHSEDDPVISLLEKYPNAILIQQNYKDIGYNINKFEQFILKKHSAIPLKDVELMFPMSIPRNIISEIKNIKKGQTID